MTGGARGGAATAVAILGSLIWGGAALAEASPTLSVGVRNERAEPLCVATAEPRYDVIRVGPPLDTTLKTLRTLASEVETGGVQSDGRGIDLEAFAQRIKALGVQTCRAVFKDCVSAPEALDLGDDLLGYAQETKRRAAAITAAVDAIAAGLPYPAAPDTRGGPGVLHEHASQNWDSGAVGFVTVKGLDCVEPRGYREVAPAVSLVGTDFQLGVHVPPPGALEPHGPRPLTGATMQLAGGPHETIVVGDPLGGLSLRAPAAREPDRSASVPVSAANTGRSLSIDDIMGQPAGETLPTEDERLGGRDCTHRFWACMPRQIGAEGFDSVVLHFAGEGGGEPADRAHTSCQTLYGSGVSAVEFLGCRWPRKSEPATVIVP